MQKGLTFFSKNFSVYAIFNDQSLRDTCTLTNGIVSFEQLDPGCLVFKKSREYRTMSNWASSLHKAIIKK